MGDAPQTKRATELLLSRIPEFASARSTDQSFMSHAHDSPYLVFGDFAFFVLQQLDDSKAANHERLRPSFQLIDEILTSPDPELINLIQVGVLEVLADHPGVLEVVESYLSREGKQRLRAWMTLYPSQSNIADM